jgi:hypothetical protein
MSDPYLIVLWCADTARLASFAGAHLLHEGLSAINSGRIGGDIPVVVGVANTRRWPIFSREVAARGFLRARQPRVNVRERYDFFLSFTSGAEVDAAAPMRYLVKSGVIAADELLAVLETTSPSAMSKSEVIDVFMSAARPITMAREQHNYHTDLAHVADTCQRLITALAT